ncbi:bifunctional YncE family protein/alkaline phosphatase family protein [Aquirufa beregesia]
MKIHFSKSLCLLGFFCALIIGHEAIAQVPSKLQQDLQKKRVRLPNGWKLSPHGKSLSLGDLPLNLAVSANKQWMVATNNGQSIQSLQLIDTRSNEVVHSIEVAKSWYGVAIASDNKTVYASGGNDNKVLKFEISNKQLIAKGSISLTDKVKDIISPTGMALDDERGILYVVSKDNNKLYLVDVRQNKVSDTFPLPAEGFTCLLSPKRDKLYISIWGGAQILPFNCQTKSFDKGIAVGDHPNEILLTKDGNTLFVANANDNSVSVLNTRTNQVIEVLNAALFPNALEGSSTNGLALSEDEERLYISNADNNCLAVFEVEKPGKSKSLGFIPVGWYPTAVKVIGKTVYVANGKGFSSFANPKGPNPLAKIQKVTYQQADNEKKAKVEYIGGLMKGTMSLFQEPSDAELAILSKAVYTNTPYNKQIELQAKGEKGNPIPTKVGGKSPIKYVFYILKENRTYDQVLADVKGGNGDLSLLLFGEKVTPNQHKLVKDFVLLDNFYVDGEVSSDGHNWSTSAHATDYLEKTWPTGYGGRGGKYDGEGNRTIANPKNGFIWDFCKRAGVSYRTYGEFADDFKPNIPSIEGHFCPDFPSFDQKIMDTLRFNRWKKEFDALLAKNQVPQFNSLRFPNDHTEGQKLGSYTPTAFVAENDYAIGLFVEHLSKSKIWKETAIFIVEDDAQNGSDHVDAHRTTAYVAGGFVKRGFVDHTPYSTSSMLRTMELILGIPPMSQYDAAATPMYKCFTSKADVRPFQHIAPQVDIFEKNVADNASARLSEKLDFSMEDAIPDLVLNQIIWKSIRGEHSEMPAPRRAAILNTKEDEEDED